MGRKLGHMPARLTRAHKRKILQRAIELLTVEGGWTRRHWKKLRFGDARALYCINGAAEQAAADVFGFTYFGDSDKNKNQVLERLSVEALIRAKKGGGAGSIRWNDSFATSGQVVAVLREKLAELE